MDMQGSDEDLLAKKSITDDRQKLRAEAEARFARAPPAARPKESAADLLHELQVHQIELEMQNEELRRVQVELEESRDRYLDLYDFAPVGYLTVSADGRIEEANLTAADLLGIDRGSMLSRPLAAFLGQEEDADRWHRFLSTLGPDGKQEALHLALRRSDGSVFNGHMACRFKATGDSRATVRIALTDTTERRKVEESLRSTRDYLEKLIGNASAPVIVWDPGRKITIFNEASEVMTGYSAAEVLGKDLELLFPEESCAESLARIAATAEGSRLKSVELPIRCKSGAIRLALWNSANVYRSDGASLKATIAQGQDITERKRAEEALRESEARLRAFVDAIPGPVFLKDADSRWLVGNRALFEAAGKSASFAIGKTDREIFDDPAVGGTVMENDRRIMKSGVPEVVEEIIPTPAGTRIFHSTKAPHRDASGRVVGIIGSALDITETRTLQGQLAVASRLAAMGTLVAGVAHEINNPLTGVMAGVGTAMLDVQSNLARLERGEHLGQEASIERDREVLEMLREASEAAARIKRIVRDLSVFGAPSQKRTRLRTSDIVAGAMRWLPSSVHTLATVSVEDLGAPDVKASHGQLEQVLVNLLTNAAKATRPGAKGTILIRVLAGSPGRTRLEVVDHGTGIDPAILSKIFDPFFTTRPAGEGRGTGLGLSICHAIVTDHGGTITVESEAGKGSTFRVELPAAPY